MDFGFPSPRTPVVTEGFTYYIEYLTSEGATITNPDVLLYSQYQEIAGDINYVFDTEVEHEFLYQTSYWMGTSPDSPTNKQEEDATCWMQNSTNNKGTFISISLVILMIIIAVSLLIYSRKKSIFKKI